MGNAPKPVEKSEFVDSSKKGSKGITYQTIGTTLQALSVQLDEGESINSESGRMAWMTENIKMQTKGQGLGKMLSRIFAQESLFINQFTAEAGTGIITFATDQNGKIVPIELKEGDNGIIFQSGAYLCSELGIERSTVLTRRITTGFFGGKGFIMQKVKGKGKVHLISDGEVVLYELSKGETMLVDQGNLLAFEETVDFDIQTVKGGVKNWLFGGEGIFFGSLKGPGRVWMQTRKLSVQSAALAASYGGRNRGAAQNPLGCIISIVVTIIGLVACLAISFLSSYFSY